MDNDGLHKPRDSDGKGIGACKPFHHREDGDRQKKDDGKEQNKPF